jgi:anti-sigma regulatory factor (Ser/Thr protein kinase)
LTGAAGQPRSAILHPAVLGSPALEIELPAVAGSLAVVREALAGVGQAVGMDPRPLDDLKVAVSEACTNVVLHAYEGAAGPGTVAVGVWHREPRLLVRVRDTGAGMVPRLDRRGSGLGLGLRLMATLTAELTIVTEAGEGTAVWMTFDAPGGPEPPARLSCRR